MCLVTPLSSFDLFHLPMKWVLVPFWDMVGKDPHQCHSPKGPITLIYHLCKTLFKTPRLSKVFNTKLRKGHCSSSTCSLAFSKAGGLCPTQIG